MKTQHAPSLVQASRVVPIQSALMNAQSAIAHNKVKAK
jgi:hypothetical protein